LRNGRHTSKDAPGRNFLLNIYDPGEMVWTPPASKVK
jgi:hypothetical protein